MNNNNSIMKCSQRAHQRCTVTILIFLLLATALVRTAEGRPTPAPTVPQPPLYSLSLMLGRWFPSELSEVRHNDPYQYFLIDANTSSKGTGPTEVGGNGVGQAREGSMLMTNAQAVSACEAIGGTILSNFNYPNLGFIDDLVAEQGAVGIDTGAAIWFGFTRRRPQTTSSKTLETFSMADGRPALSYTCPTTAKECTATPMTHLHLPAYYAENSNYLDADSDDCYALSRLATQDVQQERLAPRRCGASAVSRRIEVPVRGPPENPMDSRTVDAISLTTHKALAVCQRPYVDGLGGFSVPVPYHGLRPRLAPPSQWSRMPIAPQSRWVRAPQVLSTAAALTADDDEAPARPRAAFNSDATKRAASSPPTPPPMAEEVLEANQPTDDVASTIELFVSPIGVDSAAAAKTLCESMDADLAIIPSVAYAQTVVFPAVAALHGSVRLQSGTNNGRYAGSRFFVGCHYAGVNANPAMNIRYDRAYTLEDTSLLTATGAAAAMARGGEAAVRALPSFNTGTAPDALCLPFDQSRPREPATDDFGWLGLAWGDAVSSPRIAAPRCSFESVRTSQSLYDRWPSGTLCDMHLLRCPSSMPPVGLFGDAYDDRSACFGVPKRHTLCTRQAMRVSAVFTEGTDVIAGSTVALRLSVSHILPSFGYVLVAVTAPTQHGLIFSPSVVNFTLSSPDAIDVAVYLPMGLATNARVTVSAYVVYPVGAGVNSVVRWLRSKRDVADAALLSVRPIANRPLNSLYIVAPYTLTFYPSTLVMAKGELVTVEARLGRVSRGDFVIASDYTNAFVSAPFLDFPKGTSSLTFTVSANQETGGQQLLLNFTGIPLDTPHPIFGVPSSSVFYLEGAPASGARFSSQNAMGPSKGAGSFLTLGVTVLAPSALEWSMKSDALMYDGYDDKLQWSLVLAQVSQPFIVRIVTNCTPYVEVVTAPLDFKPGTLEQYFVLQRVRNTYYREVTCRIEAIPSLSTQQAPPPIHFSYRQRVQIQIARFPSHSFVGDSASIVFNLSHVWSGMVFKIEVSHVGTGCPAPSIWSVTSDEASWTWVYPLPNATATSLRCRVAFNTNLPDSSFMNRRVVYNSTELISLPPWVRHLWTDPAAYRHANVDRLGGDYRTIFPNVPTRFRVWVPETHVADISGFSKHNYTAPYVELSRSEVDAYSASGGTVFCLSADVAPFQNIRLVPFYDATLQMFFAEFSGGFQSSVGASTYTLRTSFCINNGSGEFKWSFNSTSFVVQPLAEVGLILTTQSIDGSVSWGLPSQLVSGTVYTALFFPTAPMKYRENYRIWVGIRMYSEDNPSNPFYSSNLVLSATESGIPRLGFTIPTSPYRVTCFSWLSSVIGMPYPAGEWPISSPSVPLPLTVQWAAAPGTYNGGAFRTEFCHTISLPSGSSISVNISVVLRNAADSITIVNGSRASLGTFTPVATVCVRISCVTGGFSLVAVPYSASTGAGASVAISFTVTQQLRFLRAFPMHSFSRSLMIDRWPVAPASDAGVPEAEFPFVSGAVGSPSLTIEVASYGEALPVPMDIRPTASFSDGDGVTSTSVPFVALPVNVSLTPSTPSGSLTEGRDASTSSVPVPITLQSLARGEIGGRHAHLSFCAAAPSSHINCPTLVLVDPPAEGSLECAVRPDGYVPAHYGALDRSTAGQRGAFGTAVILPSVTVFVFNNVSEEGNLSEDGQPIVAGVYDPPLGLSLTPSSLAFSRYASPSRFFTDAQYSASGDINSNFSTLELITTLTGGGGGEAAISFYRNPLLDRLVEPYGGGGSRMDPSAYVPRTLAAEVGTSKISCRSGSALWAVPAKSPSLSNLSMTMRPGDRGEQVGFLTIAPPPWYASSQQRQRDIVMSLSAVGGVNASFITFVPASISLRYNLSASVLETVSSLIAAGRGAGSADPTFGAAIGRYKFRMFSNSLFGSANVSIRVTFDPPSPFYKDYVHAHNITVVPLLQVSADLSGERAFFGCYDYIMATITLETLPARPIFLGPTASDPRLVVAANPESIFNASTDVNFSIPLLSCNPSEQRLHLW